MSESVRFDRAAEFYDRSRELPEDAIGQTLELLERELRGRGRVLEVGVGTGLLALPLHERGIPLAGLDLSGPMLAKLVEKAGGSPPFPVAVADATRMGLRDDAVGAAYLRWVLHLVPAWPAMLAEIARVIQPGGVFLVSMGSYGGAYRDIQQRFADLTGISTMPVGLDWEAYEELDAAMAALGGAVRKIPPLDVAYVEPLEEFVRGIEEDRYSWTWSVPEDVRMRAAADVRAWSGSRFGSLEESYTQPMQLVWRAYDLP